MSAAAPPLYEEVAALLNRIGWRSPSDPHWSNLQAALPELRALLGADDAFRDACILAALPAVLPMVAAHDNWEDATVARRCIELATEVVAARNRA